MAPTTRSGAKPKSETAAAKSPKVIKKKPQPKKQTGKKADKTEEVESTKVNVENPENGDKTEITEQEASNDAETSVASEQSPKSNKRKAQPKKQAAKKASKSEENKNKKSKIDDEENEDDQEVPEVNSTSDAKTIYEFTVKDIDGNEVSLEKYRGNVCIIVNVASRCGHTKSNYEQFVELYDKYSESKELKILAFPCNQFGSQESGTCEKIKAFAENKGVKFDMFDKIEVNGKNASPLWQFLKEKLPEVTSGKATGKDIKWNFTKFIIDKEGVPVERYASGTKPLTLVDSLEKLW